MPIMFPSGKPLKPINALVSNYILMVLGVTCPTKHGDRFDHKNHPEIPARKVALLENYVVYDTIYPQFVGQIMLENSYTLNSDAL